MGAFKRTVVEKYKKHDEAANPENAYWRMAEPHHIKEFGAIDNIDFSPVNAESFAITCSVRVQVYNAITMLVTHNLSKFQLQAYGGTFRRDGRLLVAGDEEHFVRLFDVSSKNMLRLFKGHKAPVHRTYFTTDTNIVSFSDDRTVRFWDIPSETVIKTFDGHTDYIRAGCVNPTTNNIVISGGYDGLVKMYDLRAQRPVMELKHGTPVEAIVMHPTGGVFFTAGGTEIKVWDSIAGGKQLANLMQHHKTVTTLKLASNGKRLISGSLDKHCKIIDIAKYQVVHNIDFPNSILSVAISSDDKFLTGGMVDGTVAVYRREAADEELPSQPLERKKFALVEKVDEVIKQEKRDFEARYDKMLRKFEYGQALSIVMRPYVAVKTPHVTVALMKELIRRKGLERALQSRSHSLLARVIKFIKCNIGDYRFTRTLTDVANIIINVYEDRLDEFGYDMTRLFLELAEKLKEEVALTYQFLELKGGIELLLSAANIEQADKLSEASKQFGHMTIEASEAARKKSIINVDV